MIDEKKLYKKKQETPVERLLNEDFKGTQPWPLEMENSAFNCAFNSNEISKKREVRNVLVTGPFMANGRDNVSAKWLAEEF